MDQPRPQFANSRNNLDGIDAEQSALPSVVRELATLVERGARFSTVYADPPWPYQNTAARGAAENHYRTMTLKDICNEPVKKLVADNAHLHLWTTNAFLHEAFDVIRAWGFRYKSCLVWIKPQLGMGNYWRVSHEYLLFGIRGNISFADHTCRSWLMARRSIHSRKPFAFRELVERVSPGPYLELYGREEHPNTDWTIYGNQVERKLF
jgi:N6-adenosine-specific RNA methylase IME4